MKKLFLALILLFFAQYVYAFEDVNIQIMSNKHTEVVEKPQLVTGAVSLLEAVPSGFYGTWKVYSVAVETTDPFLFNSVSVDTWKLEKNNNYLTLTNPESGATATVTLDTVDGNTIKFIRKSDTPYESVTEIPRITLNGENFYGTDTIIIKKHKNGNDIDDVIKFKIKGIKQSGVSVNDLITK